jgi:hypothetical protein
VKTYVRLSVGAAAAPWRRFLLEGAVLVAFGPIQLVVVVWFLGGDSVAFGVAGFPAAGVLRFSSSLMVLLAFAS